MRAMIACLFLGMTGAAFAESHETTTTSHGISAFGELKYPADFPHFEFVNPDAPKGGTWSTGHEGTYDSFNPYALKGTPSLGVADVIYGRTVFDTLMAEAHDELHTTVISRVKETERAQSHCVASSTPTTTSKHRKSHTPKRSPQGVAHPRADESN